VIKIEVRVIKVIGFKIKSSPYFGKASLGGIKMKKLSIWLLDSFQIREIISHIKSMSSFFNNFFQYFFNYLNIPTKAHTNS
jgi:hypothetical protein